VKLTLRVPRDVYDQLDRLRDKEGITLQGAGLVALRQYLEAKKTGA
jgi:hypothetical protein